MQIVDLYKKCCNLLSKTLIINDNIPRGHSIWNILGRY